MRPRTTVTTVVLIILVLAAFGALADYEAAICTDSADQESPAVSGNIVVWHDFRNDPGDFSECDIYGYNLSTSSEFSVVTASKWQTEPAVSGDIVVWADERNDPGDFSECDIYAKNLSTSTEFSVCTATGWQYAPEISGHIVVWIDERDIATNGSDIYGYNLDTGVEFPICTAVGNQWLGGIYGDIVVWEDWRNAATTEVDIYGYDLSTGMEFPISIDIGWQFAPAIYGDIVAWVDDRNFAVSDDDIYGYNLASGQQFAICTASGAQESPSVSGTLVAWVDYRNDPGNNTNRDIYAYDLGTSQEVAISTAAGNQEQPACGANVVVWRDDRNYVTSGYDIYSKRQTELTPTAAFSAVPRSGSSPLEVDFYDLSTGAISSYAWNFGDTQTSTEQNPTHTYSSSGAYTVTLTVTSEGGSDAETKVNYIVVDSVHAVSVSASVLPTTLASGGEAQLSATASCSQGHGITSWSWDDNGAGGSFAPNATTQNPAWTAPGNLTGSPVGHTLTVTATCSESQSASAGVSITENSLEHEATVSASANPSTVENGNSTELSATFSDTLGHSAASWSWSDNGAGGTFTPNANTQNPTWTAPGNLTGAPIDHTLTVNVTCDGASTDSDSANVTVTENSAVHTIVLLAGADPETFASGETTQLSATAVDELGHNITSWSWDDNGAGGSFSPSATAQNPTWTGPGNTGFSDILRQLTVTATCDGTPSLQSSADVYVTEEPRPTMTVNFPAAGLYQFSLPLKNPDRLDGRWVLRPLISDDSRVIDHIDPVGGGTVQLATWSNPAQAYTYGVLDDLVDPELSYFIDVSGACSITLTGEPFDLNMDVSSGWNMIGAPSQSVDIRTELGDIDLTSGPWNWSDSGGAYVKSYILTPGKGYWIQSANTGTLGYTPSLLGLMSLELMQNEEQPEIDGPTLSEFSDVPVGHWAYEAAGTMRWLSISGGAARDYELDESGSAVIPEDEFDPEGRISRAQLAIFLVRAFDLPLPAEGQGRFADVPPTHPAARHIEAVCALGIMGAYEKEAGGFYPRKEVSRAQAAEAVARALGMQLTTLTVNKSSFSDVPAGHWAAAEINALNMLGAFDGKRMAFNRFQPNSALSRGDLALWLHNLLYEPEVKGSDEDAQ